MAGRFVGIPEIPTSGGILEWQSVLFNAIKENTELLTATRGEADQASRAVVRGDVTATQLGTQQMVAVAAKGTGFVISGNKVAGLDDYGLLVNDVQLLANDLATTRNTLNLLLRNMTGG